MVGFSALSACDIITLLGISSHMHTQHGLWLYSVKIKTRGAPKNSKEHMQTLQCSSEEYRTSNAAMKNTILRPSMQQ
jgi:hypothetical protein